MRLATSITRQIDNPLATITLDETARHRRRMVMISDPLVDGSTVEFLLDLPKAKLLRHGDGLVLDDGNVIEVHAAPELLYEVRGQSSRHLLVLSWQLGNRHLPSQIMIDHIRIRADHVIKDMLEGLGAEVLEINDAFDPEGGAYDGHGHEH